MWQTTTAEAAARRTAAGVSGSECRRGRGWEGHTRARTRSHAAVACCWCCWPGAGAATPVYIAATGHSQTAWQANNSCAAQAHNPSARCCCRRRVLQVAACPGPGSQLTRCRVMGLNTRQTTPPAPLPRPQHSAAVCLGRLLTILAASCKGHGARFVKEGRCRRRAGALRGRRTHSSHSCRKE
jgi:hypothetical protein